VFNNVKEIAIFHWLRYALFDDAQVSSWGDKKAAMAQQERVIVEKPPTSFSWWSWRPGIRPGLALLIGGPLTMLALLLLALGMFTLIGGILDSSAPPLQLRGVITGHSSSRTGQIYELHIRLLPSPEQAADFPPILSLSVSQAVFQHFHNGQMILVDYAPHLLTPYALSSLSRPQLRYPLPGTSAAGDIMGALALLLIGLLLLPYPALLTHWGWRDLIARLGGTGGQSQLATIIERRSYVPDPLAKRPAQPGLLRIGTRPTYGIAVQLTGSATPTKVLAFRVDAERYMHLYEGMQVRLTYSPHLHYLYGMEPLL
jgi:hypothetical protein